MRLYGLIFAFQAGLMNIHKEGYKSIALSALLFGAINIIFFYFFSASEPVIGWIIFFTTLALLLFIISWLTMIV